MTTIDVNSLSVLQAMKFFLIREKHRHYQDIAKIDRDLYALREIDIPDTLDMDAWYEIVTKTGTNVPKTGTYTTKGE